MPSGTVGGRIAWAKTRSSSARSQSSIASRGVADHDRHDLGPGAADVEALIGERPSEDRPVSPQVLDHARLAVQQPERRERRPDHRAAAARSRR